MLANFHTAVTAVDILAPRSKNISISQSLVWCGVIVGCLRHYSAIQIYYYYYYYLIHV